MRSAAALTARALRARSKLLSSLHGYQSSFAMARTNETVRAGLARSGLLAQIGEEHLFASVGEAVNALHP
jgi:MFS superfamily sulfate permease-like transporter